MSGISISSEWDDEQTGTCSLTYNIYSTGGGLVYTKQFANQSRPGSGSWSWDGKDSRGVTAEKGLYAVKATVTSNIPTVSSDRNRSSYLEIMRENYEAEFAGYDDNSAPTDESDDSYLYYIKSYKLKDTNNSDASSGNIKLYAPNLSNVMTWDIEDLPCVLHSDNHDGLETSATGLAHELLVSVPVDVMEEEYDGEVWRFVVHAEDDNADMYKTHQTKPAIDLNEKMIYKRSYNYDCLINNQDRIDLWAYLAQKRPFYGLDENDIPQITKGYCSYARAIGSAIDIYNDLKKSGLFHFFGHGWGDLNPIVSKGGVICGSNGQDVLVANKCDELNCYCQPFTGMDDNMDLSNCKLIVWMACYSGNDITSHGSMAQCSIDLGTESAIGFNDKISYFVNFGGPECIWAQTFWDTLCRSSNVDTDGVSPGDYPDAMPRDIDEALAAALLRVNIV